MVGGRKREEGEGTDVRSEEAIVFKGRGHRSWLVGGWGGEE